MDYERALLAFFVSLATVLIVTPIVKKFAIKIGAVDQPNKRKVHDKVMPRMGGLAIFIGVAAGALAGGLFLHNKITAISVGAVLIVILGIFDDKYNLSAKFKFLVQVLVACLIVSTGLKMDFFSVPFLTDRIELGWMAYPLTVLWIVGITNAINLIDGLDGLAAGISVIGLSTIAVMAFSADKILILSLSLVVIGSTIGFLFYNFHPAKIFMGDTGSLFLGYMISVLSLLGLYKSVTLFSVVVPVIILGVPIFDTTFAIIRRILNKQPISSPDKSHIHHRLMAFGLSHRMAVIVIYMIGLVFSLSAILLTSATIWLSLIIIFLLVMFMQVIAEVTGLVNEEFKPFTKFYKRMVKRQ
ncbi:glycosyltransferase family 4 protein [Bacillus pumilus]|uniref:glycosyltransferase family 4 protein n=1 Tax=Bacillus pumilus TaxID=1408 RepID=UPI00227E888C|nr:MraY family glycosyltransferase [Bacillus pumilus]MCY7502065.1 undecaprenyl/decaprenyl-phosphate alpha-N-acetylglucosaminyl 1-phosphate transferase [Bacillus pumilus]MCY7529484.1 undecaprenyl/decaprenyl-phosphate alpha-N-acetylglucosaminyl 1-phosphate transferase [Bacillus pumilus]MED4438066.1 MraY family glycosyltransferase [Bacillus pumilus]MED4489330.1 MraY family glycosyltransferase [Bacillus pumilus]